MNKIKIKNIEGLVRDWEKWKLTRDQGVWQRLWECSEYVKRSNPAFGCGTTIISGMIGAPLEGGTTSSELCLNVSCEECPFSSINSKIQKQLNVK